MPYVVSLEALDRLELPRVEAWAREELDRKDRAREQALRLSRALIRSCATSIRSVHRRELAAAEAGLAEALSLHAELTDKVRPFGDLYWAGYVQDAEKELTEALATFALVRGRPLPDPAVLGFAPGPFLNGLAEAVGELRRYILDTLRRGETHICEDLLEAMDSIYGLLVSLDYPDAITAGLRRSTDNTRAILERTRGDLTFALRQEALTRALVGEHPPV